MYSLVNRVYLKFRKQEVLKAKMKLKKITINSIMKNLTNTCWKYGVQYEVILKTSDMIIVLLRGRREEILFKYHKKHMIFMDDFSKFLNYLDDYESSKGIYITTGVFENSIMKLCNHFIYKKIKLINNYNFIREQLGFNRKAYDVFKYNKLNFIKYLPQ